MLPHSYELPAAILLVLGGALSCFAGYRLFKIVLGIYGFVIGARLGALVAHVAWDNVAHGDPPAVAVIVLSVLGAIAAMFLQRYVIIVATAFAGAWTVIVGGLALSGDTTAARAASTGDVWILYPTTPAPGQRWVPVAWIVLGLVGTGVQLGITGRKRK